MKTKEHSPEVLVVLSVRSLEMKHNKQVLEVMFQTQVGVLPLISRY